MEGRNENAIKNRFNLLF